jgi:hypothetical protein
MRNVWRYKFKLLVLASLSSLGFIALSLVVPAQPAKAAGETYTWVDYSNIKVSGGHFTKPVTIPLLIDSSGPGDNALFRGDVQYSLPCQITTGAVQSNAYFSLDIYVSPSDSAHGKLLTSGGTKQPACADPGSPTPKTEFDSKTVLIDGVRPPKGGQPNPGPGAGEKFSWADYQTIDGTGGHFANTASFLRRQNTPTVEYFTASVEYTGTCGKKVDGTSYSGHFTMRIILTNGTAAVLDVPIDQHEAGNGSGTPLCDTSAGSVVVKEYSGRHITIDGTRPNPGDTKETQQQRNVNITLYSPKPASQSPQTVTATIKTPDGKVVGTPITSKQTPAPGETGRPADQQSVMYVFDFYLDPGKYQVCFSDIITTCQAFEKVKFVPLVLAYGETSSDRVINVTVEVPITRPCGQTLTFGPAIVTLKYKDGTERTAKTGTYTSTPFSNEEGSSCSVHGIATMYTFFDNVPPGNYTVCLLNGNVCADVVKVQGQAANVILHAPLNFQEPDEQPVCTTGRGWASSIAWLLCPVTRLIVSAMSFIEQHLIIPYLTVSPLSTDPANPVYKLWESVRNIANIAFIIAFFFIIFSQATSYGLSNYGIKRMLPRLIIVAIAANVSYYIAALSIDAFNIIGSGIAQLVIGVLANGGGGNQGTNADWTQFFAVSAIGLGATLVTAGSAIGWLGTLIIIVGLIVFMTVIILVVRQMLILALVIASPLLVVGTLLPNTERAAKKNIKRFFKLLALYPIIVVLFAAGKIVASLLNSGDLALATGDNISTGMAEAIKVIFATFANAFPLVLLPGLLLSSEELLGKLGSMLRERGLEAFAHGSNRLRNSNFAKYLGSRRERANAQTRAGNYTGINPFRRVQSAISGRLNRSAPYNLVTEGYGAQQLLGDRQLRSKDLSETEKLFSGDWELASAWIASGGNRKAPEYAGLTDAQKRIFDDLRLRRYGKAAEPFMAAMHTMSSEGYGNAATLAAAEAQVRRFNPGSANVDIEAMRETTKKDWREHGRGDLANVDLGTGAVSPDWDATNFNNNSRFVYDTSPENSGNYTARTRTQRKPYNDPSDGHLLDWANLDDRPKLEISNAEVSQRNYLAASRENMLRFVTSLRQQEQRASEGARAMLFDMLRGTDRGKYNPKEAGHNYVNDPAKMGELLDQLRDDFNINYK